MAARIPIPAALTIVTLNGQSQRWDESYARKVLEAASALLEARAQIGFYLDTFERATDDMPTGTRSDVVDDSGYLFLEAKHKAPGGVRVLLVDRVARPELGGESRWKTRVCLIPFASDLPSTSRKLAHEFGHLLELEHVDKGGPAGPGQERLTAARMRNLMYSGALNPDAELTSAQVQQARSSTLARRFSS